MEIPTKTCVHCGDVKPLSAFPKNPHTKDRLSSWCKSCHYGAVKRTREKLGI